MGLLNFFRGKKENTAKLAKERLQIIIAHERAQNRPSHEFLPKLEKELLDVIRRYVQIADDAVKVKLDRDGDVDVLELNIVLPDQVAKE
ncbi:MAG: cell division topological specificity factor MinE [Halothiobacillaceae bacterium]|nr:cell division topological specificity factor MinE [Halothiobacillaceae bacterium]OYY74480.1 MAG: cell division topological specificity factor MinE [Gammaproteobacteria bacterium 28-57-27]